MAKVDLLIGGNSYAVACRDGEEASLLAAAATYKVWRHHHPLSHTA